MGVGGSELVLNEQMGMLGLAEVVVVGGRLRQQWVGVRVDRIYQFRCEQVVYNDPATGEQLLYDGACALVVASASAVERYSLKPRARFVTCQVAGVEPRIMGIGPAPASRKALARAGLQLDHMDTIELNEAFASQALAVLRELGLEDDAIHVNPNGGAIALGHPLGMSGARLVTTAIHQLHDIEGRYALCTMCIGVGQGIASIFERT